MLLINRLQAEKKAYKHYYEECLKNLKDAHAEIERLKRTPKCVYAYDGEVIEYCVEGPCSAEKTIETIKSEARKEFAENLKQDIKDHRLEMFMNGLKGTPRTREITYECVEEYIDNLLEEMEKDL